MAQINVTNLTYGYENSFDLIFENVSFSIDTNWKLGLIGRNGKGKTTFLNLLQGKYEYTGTIASAERFDYFPYQAAERHGKECAAEFLEECKPGCEQWRVICELGKLGADAELLYRPFETLSWGERTKVLLAALFSGENEFLLIDEPTNHLDHASREIVKQYLREKKGFILVSHDRDLLDACIDHVLVLNRKTIEVQSGNFTSWWENKRRADQFALAENEKHRKEIATLRKTADRSARWAEKNENTKIGYDPIKEHDRCKGTRSYIGAKTKKMQSRVTQFERRIEREIEKKEGLLQDIENPAALKLNPLRYHKERLVWCRDLSLGYGQTEKPVLQDFSFELLQGERVFLQGENGCGKSTLIRAILEQAGHCNNPVGVPMRNNVYPDGEKTSGTQIRTEQWENGNAAAGHTVTGGLHQTGELHTASGLIISCVSQDTGFLQGGVKEFCRSRKLDESLFFTLLKKLDLERVQFDKRLEELSEGQKKKVLIAASLMTPAHVYIWDEPLNYIDVFSRMQIEELILAYKPTMLLVDHDVRFREKIATRVVDL